MDLQPRGLFLTRGGGPLGQAAWGAPHPPLTSDSNPSAPHLFSSKYFIQVCALLIANMREHVWLQTRVNMCGCLVCVFQSRRPATDLPLSPLWVESLP